MLERRISALDSREDEVYRKWRNEYHELRYRAPIVTRLFQVAFRIAPLNRGRRAEAPPHRGLASRAAVSVVSRGGAEEAVARADGCDRDDPRCRPAQRRERGAVRRRPVRRSDARARTSGRDSRRRFRDQPGPHPSRLPGSGQSRSADVRVGVGAGSPVSRAASDLGACRRSR